MAELCPWDTKRRPFLKGFDLGINRDASQGEEPDTKLRSMHLRDSIDRESTKHMS